jgi:hypothetical protein
MVYQFNPDMPPDACFHPGDLKYVVPGNEGRLLDPRRTPVRVLEVKPVSGFFVVEILDFEDKGGRWELPLECVDRCQFAQGSAEARKADVARYTEIIASLDRPLEIPADPSRQSVSDATIASLRAHVGAWLERESTFLKSGASLDFAGRTGNPHLWTDLKRYMTEENLWDVEEAFADHYVRSFNFGELLKGHGIVLAELGLVSFEGKQVRDPDLFAGPWSRQRRANHILHRLAFVRELFGCLGHSSLVLYRGFSCQGQPEDRGHASFLSATFSLEVAMSHFNERDRASTGVLVRQPVPIERIFMSFLETVQLNQSYKEAEAVLLHDGAKKTF